MNFVDISTDIRRRAASLPNQPWHGGVDEALGSLTRLATSGALGEPAFVQELLLVLAAVNAPADFQIADVELLQPETIRRLDLVLNALIEGGLTRNDLRDAVRPALIRQVKE